jgi:hypothetical protein
VESKSIQGVALIKLQFHPGTNTAEAVAETVSYVDRARAFTPTGTLPPFVMRFDGGSVPVGDLVFSSRTKPVAELQDAANADIAEADVGVAEANLAFAAAQVKLAAATVERVKTLINYEQIVAPFDGVVARRLVNRGDLVQAATSTRTTPLFTVQRIDTIRVFSDVPENDVPDLHIGDPAIVKPYGLEGKTFVGP